MSRGQKPRTPVYFPKMKVRGARNKRKSAARHQQFHTMRVNVEHVGVDHVDFVASAEGTHLISYKTACYDGWGRIVPEPPPQPKPRPKPKERPTTVVPATQAFGNVGILTDSGELVPVKAGLDWKGLSFEPEPDEPEESWTWPSGSYSFEMTTDIPTSDELWNLLTGQKP